MSEKSSSSKKPKPKSKSKPKPNAGSPAKTQQSNKDKKASKKKISTRNITDEDRASVKPLLQKRHSLKTQRALKKKEPQVVEGPKSAMFIRGSKTSPELSQALVDLRHLKEPYIVPYTRKNQIRPFEDPSSVEFFSSKNECALFCLASHTKKRPHNLIFGRLFEHQLLDMVEVGLSDFRSMQATKGGQKSAIGSPPCFLFKGDKFEFSEEYKLLKAILLDFFRGEEKELVNLASLDHVIFVGASPVDDTIHFRHCAIRLKKSGTKVPRVELENIGPSFDLTIRRTKFAAGDMAKMALQQPKETHPSKVKNVTTNVFGQRIGTVHMHRQDFEKMKVKKQKVLKRVRADGDGGGEAAAAAGAPLKKRMKVE